MNCKDISGKWIKQQFKTKFLIGVRRLAERYYVHDAEELLI